MEHLFADISLSGDDAERLSPLRHERVGANGIWPLLSLAERALRSEHLCGMNLWIHRPLFPWRPGRDAVEALLAGRPRPLSWLGSVRWLSEAAEAGRFLRRKLAGEYCLRVNLEQTPSPDNRIQLSAQGDAIGQPQATLAFRVTEEDRSRHCRALRVAAKALGLDGDQVERELQRCFAERRIGFFWHHMGTTRMHDDPRQGVVNRHGRAHGVSNLFVAGSSVFPTGGAAPPTLTIVALAIRLAEHVAKERFGRTA
jgi:choline dehydrogenase-like flavoprotein